MLHIREHFLLIVFDCSFSSCRVFFIPISGSSWCKNCPMFFSKPFQTYFGRLQVVLCELKCFFLFFIFFENLIKNYK